MDPSLSINPETLMEETPEERSLRQRRTEVLGSGLNVLCRPDPIDPLAVNTQNRGVCLFRPYPTCTQCAHRLFTVSFNALHKEHRLAVVQCPRWEKKTDRLKGIHPQSYASTEVATCQDKPFEYCASCPSQKELVQLGLDKTKEGWFGRYDKYRKEAFEND